MGVCHVKGNDVMKEQRIDNNELIGRIKNYLNDTYTPNYEISYILSKIDNNYSKELKAVAFNSDDYEDLITLNIRNNEIIKENIADWDFNVDEYLLDDLENGYEFVYAPLNQHYNIWCQINEWRDEIIHQEGLQKYLVACQNQEITKEKIESLGYETADITDLIQVNSDEDELDM